MNWNGWRAWRPVRVVSAKESLPRSRSSWKRSSRFTTTPLPVLRVFPTSKIVVCWLRSNCRDWKKLKVILTMTQNRKSWGNISGIKMSGRTDSWKRLRPSALVHLMWGRLALLEQDFDRKGDSHSPGPYQVDQLPAGAPSWKPQCRNWLWAH